MKKIILLMALFICISFTACSKPTPESVEVINTTNNKAPQEAVSQSDSTSLSENHPLRDSFMSKLKEGKIEEINYTVGSQGSEIVEALGQPEEAYCFLGGIYLKYGNVIYFTDNFEKPGSVVNIGLSEGQSFNGIKIGMTFDEIKKQLGEPDSEFLGSENDELLGGSFCIVYRSGDYMATFTAYAQNSPSYAAYMQRSQ